MMGILFKDGVKSSDYYNKLDSRLTGLVIPLLQYHLYPLCVPNLIVTSMHRSDGIHSAYRAIDIRIPPGLTLATLEDIADSVNAQLVYGKRMSDGKGLCTVLVGALDPHGQHNDHIHCQVPPPYTSRDGISLRGIYEL